MLATLKEVASSNQSELYDVIEEEAAKYDKLIKEKDTLVNQVNTQL
jgi:hypothetical protein